MRNSVKGVALALLALLLATVPVLAAEYQASIAVVEDGGTSYTMLGCSVSANNDWMADNNFMKATALDTRVLTTGGAALPHMVVDDRTQFASPVSANSQTNLNFTTGNTDLTSMDIISGYNGYITTLDHADLEPGNDFDINLTDTYFDTSAGFVGTDVFDKDMSLNLSVSSTGNLTATLFNASNTITQNVAGASQTVYTGSNQRAGQRVNGFTGYITTVSFWLSKVGAPTGTGYARVRRVSDDSVIGTIGTVDVSTFGAGAAQFTFNTTPVNVTGAIDIRIVFEWAGGDAGNHVLAWYNAPAGVADNLTTYNNASVWVDSAANVDATFSVTYWSVVTATRACATGEHDIIVSADTVDLSLSVDGAATTTALGGASAAANANDWIWGSNAAPYFGQIELYQGANFRIDYNPVTMIIGTTLPNVEVPGSYEGTFTFGANPAGVTVTLGPLLDTTVYTTSTVDVETIDMLPQVSTSDWFQDPDIGVGGTLLTNPLRPFVTMLSDNSSFTELQAWRFLGLAVVLFAMAATAYAIRSHLLIAGIMGAVAIGGMVALTIFPMWTLVFSIGVIVAGAVAERSPSL